MLCFKLGIKKLVVMIINILVIDSVVVSQALERQQLQAYTSFYSTHQEKTKLNFFFGATVYAGKIASFFFVNNAYTLTE